MSISTVIAILSAIVSILGILLPFLTQILQLFASNGE